MATAPQTPASDVRLDWSKGVAPRYIALFLLIAYFDQLAPRTLAVGGLLPSALGALAAGLICHLFFFQPVALAGLRARKDIEGVALDTFGTLAGRAVTFLLALVQVVWFAIALHYAIDLTFRALVAGRLLDPRHLQPVLWNGRLVPSPMYLWVALAWSFTSAILGTVAFRLVAAIMAGYQAFPAFVLAALVAWALPSARSFIPLGVDPITEAQAAQPALQAFVRMLQLVCGFFATHAVMSADWGSASRSRSDIRRGGWVGVALASAAIAVLGLLAVAGARGRELAAGLATSAAPPDWHKFTISDVLLNDVGGAIAGVGLITFGLAMLGPVCFTPFLFARLAPTFAPRAKRWMYAILAAVLTWPLLVLRVPARLDLVFGVLGALGAPLVAVIAGRSMRESAPTARPLNLAAVVAWVVGAAVGLVPILGPALGFAPAAMFEPAVLAAYVSALVTYGIAAAMGLDPKNLVDKSSREIGQSMTH